MFNLLHQVRQRFAAWLWAAPKKPKPGRVRLYLEGLEERWCPAKATWAPQLGNTSWTNAANWSWTGPGAADLQGEDYPGDTAGRKDEVVFSSNQNCYLNQGLQANLKSLTLLSVFAKSLTLGANVTVQGGFFRFQSGALTIDSAAALTIGAAGPGQSNIWRGGNFTGAGQIDIPTGSELDISRNAGSLADTLTISGTVVVKKSMPSNLGLSGANNKIDIKNGGILNLDTQVSAANADTQGGITGGANNPIIIESGGTLERGSGKSGDNPFGQVLISAPVENQGGKFILPYSNTGANPASAVHLTGKDARGYSYDDTGSTGNALLELGVLTQLLADNGVNISANASDMLRLDVNSGVNKPTVTLTGNVNISTGILEISDAEWDDFGDPLPGAAALTGNVSLGNGATVKMNWNGNSADQIQVTGSMDLGGATLDLFGAPQPDKKVYLTYFTATKGVKNNIAATLLLEDAKYNGTFGTRLQKGGTIWQMALLT